MGLTPLPSELVKPPRIEESAFHMECRVTGKHDVINFDGNVTCTCVFGQVVRFHVLEPLLREDSPGGSKSPYVAIDGYEPMGRLGGNIWVELGNNFALERPNV